MVEPSPGNQGSGFDPQHHRGGGSFKRYRSQEERREIYDSIEKRNMAGIGGEPQAEKMVCACVGMNVYRQIPHHLHLSFVEFCVHSAHQFCCSGPCSGFLYISVKPEVTCLPTADQTDPLPVFVNKVVLRHVTLIPLHIIYCCFSATVAELSSTEHRLAKSS